MTKLNQLIRKMMLSHPLIFPTRAATLSHLFCCNGNGLEWRDGILIGSVSEDQFDEDAARAAFFDDIDDRKDALIDIVGHEDLRDTQVASLNIDRARRQFQLDHLDDLVLCNDNVGFPDAHSLLAGYYRQGWCGMNIPDDAEESHRSGALEALSHALVKMRSARLDGHPVVEEIGDEFARHQPKISDAYIAEILGEAIPQEESVKLTGFQRYRSSGCIELELDDYIALEKAEDGTLIDWDDFLNVKLEGKHLAGIPGIEGVHSVEYNGHFGAAIHYTVDSENDMPSTHAAVARMIKEQVRIARQAIDDAEKETEDQDDKVHT
jgi:hypothetical protein